MDDIDQALQEGGPAAEEFARHPSRTLESFIAVGEALRHRKVFDKAALFFKAAFALQTTSPDILLAIISCQITGRLPVAAEDMARLEQINPDYRRYATSLLLAQDPATDPRTVLRELGNCFEAFVSGAAVDWLFLRQAMALRGRAGDATLRVRPMTPIPRTIFLYWDKSPPPEIAANIQYHKALAGYETRYFDKEAASAFLYEHFGGNCRKLFLAARHPAEGSDFLRYHLIYVLGGFYVDTDEQVLSTDVLTRLSGDHDGMYILSATGPVENAVFGASAGSPVIEECLRILAYNQIFEPDLNIWLKTGPGVLTRALTRHIYRALVLGRPLSNFQLHRPEVYGQLLRGLDVSYRGDERDWRVFEERKRAGA